MDTRLKTCIIKRLSLLSAIMVIVETYVEWPSFSPLYTGSYEGLL